MEDIITGYCNHYFKDYFANYSPDVTRIPTVDEINQNRLWKCTRCQKWYSLRGTVKNKPEGALEYGRIPPSTKPRL